MPIRQHRFSNAPSLPNLRFARHAGWLCLLLVCLVSILSGVTAFGAGTSADTAGHSVGAAAYPVPNEVYQDDAIPSVLGKLVNRVKAEPFNLLASLLFLGAILHTFLTAKFAAIAHHYKDRFEKAEEAARHPDKGRHRRPSGIGFSLRPSFSTSSAR